MRIARTLEKEVQKDVAKTAKQFGCEVVSFSQPFQSAQTRGIADLRIYHRERNQAAWFEVKRDGGKQSPGQKSFQILAPMTKKVERTDKLHFLRTGLC